MGTPFSAVVVCFNEESILGRCLDSLGFCDEIIVVDLGSDDGSIELARSYGATVLPHERVPYRNKPLHHGITHARNSWIVSIDPDEAFPREDLEKVETVIREHGESISGIRFPWQYYFKGRELNTSFWGRPDASKCAIIHRERMEISPYVHKELVADGPEVFRFERGEIAPIRHYWMETYRQLFEKTWRYVQGEGAMKYEHRGQRFSWKATLKHTVAGARVSFIDYRGVLGGFRGNFLSLFYTWYVFMSWMSLRKYERRLGRGAGPAS